MSTAPHEACPACGPDHCTPSCPEKEWRYVRWMTQAERAVLDAMAALTVNDLAYMMSDDFYAPHFTDDVAKAEFARRAGTLCIHCRATPCSRTEDCPGGRHYERQMSRLGDTIPSQAERKEAAK